MLSYVYNSTASAVTVTTARTSTPYAFTWVSGGGGNWSTAYWQNSGVTYPGVYPGMVSGDTAVITNGTLSMDAPQSVAGLTLAGTVTINGSYALTDTNALSVTGSAHLQGTGTINDSAGITLAGYLGATSGSLNVGANVTASGATGYLQGIAFSSGDSLTVPYGTTVTDNTYTQSGTTAWNVAGILKGTSTAATINAPITLSGSLYGYSSGSYLMNLGANVTASGTTGVMYYTKFASGKYASIPAGTMLTVNQVLTGGNSAASAWQVSGMLTGGAYTLTTTPIALASGSILGSAAGTTGTTYSGVSGTTGGGVVSTGGGIAPGESKYGWTHGNVGKLNLSTATTSALTIDQNTKLFFDVGTTATAGTTFDQIADTQASAVFTLGSTNGAEVYLFNDISSYALAAGTFTLVNFTGSSSSISGTAIPYLNGGTTGNSSSNTASFAGFTCYLKTSQRDSATGGQRQRRCDLHVVEQHQRNLEHCQPVGRDGSHSREYGIVQFQRHPHGHR